MIYLYDVFYNLWKNLFGANFNEPSVVQLCAVVSVVGTVGWFINVIGKIPIFRRKK